MKEIILHIGPHKTASTYIQNQLHDNKDILADCGLTYPATFYEDHGHHILARSIYRKTYDDNFHSQLNELNALEDTVILSSEDFDKLSINDIRTSKIMLHEVPARIVYYFRSPSDRLISLWQEKIKFGYDEDLYSFMFTHQQNPVISRYINSCLTLDDWANVFGMENIYIIDYAWSISQNCLANSIFGALDLPCVLLEHGKNTNSMLNLKEVELLRAINTIALKHEIHRGPKLRNLFYKHLKTYKNEYDDLINKITVKEFKAGNLPYDKDIRLTIRSRYKHTSFHLNHESSQKTYAIPDTNWLIEPGSYNALKRIFDYLADKMQ